MDTPVALVLLFVVLPVVLALAVAALVQRRVGSPPAEERTSEVLRHGRPASATVMDWRTPGQSFLDRRPMVTFRVEVRGDPAFEMLITQAVPRAVLQAMTKGMTVDVRLGADGTTAAIVLPSPDDAPGA